jgi:hypothetical protein
MSIIALKSSCLSDYEPIAELEKRPPDIRLIDTLRAKAANASTST